jgi:curved DNA-binding protein CbpA
VVDYYKVLKIKQTASATEIKSAYRKLARERHPDVNGGTETAAREFALISLAYRTLSDPQERFYYDSQLKRIHSADFGTSVFHTSNPHARRLRRMAMQAYYDRKVDQFFEAERRETFAFQQAVFTTVTLFLSTFFVAWFKPLFWYKFELLGRAVVVTLFVIGLWHLAVRLKACFEHYTYKSKSSIHNSISNAEVEKPEKPFSRFTASTFLIVGYAVSLAFGLYAASVMQYFVIFKDLPYLFGQHFRADLLFYPPIAVLIVDTMHTVASKID